MDQQAPLLVPDDERQLISVMSDDWWVALGPMDLAAELVTIQRDASEAMPRSTERGANRST